jgi:hypothetical protein
MAETFGRAAASTQHGGSFERAGVTRANAGREVVTRFDFCRIYTTLRISPAMAGGFADHVWPTERIAELMN